MIIDVHSGAYRCCDGITRRSFLKTGALMLGGISLSGLLRQEAMAAAAGKAGKDLSVILFWQGGGPSQLDMWDMKPDAPSEFRGSFNPIRTNLPGYQVCEHMPRIAKVYRDDELPDEAVWRLDLSPDEVSRLRQQDALQRAAAATGDRLAELRAVLLGEREPEFAESGRAEDVSPPVDRELPEDLRPPLAKNLNPPQLAAIEFALSAKDVARARAAESAFERADQRLVALRRQVAVAAFAIRA